MPRLPWLGIAALVAVAACAPSPDAETPAPAALNAPVRLDHVLISTAPGAAAERAALEQAGFRIAPTINRHDGQGTASATVEFENGYLELVWADDSVPVTGEGGARAQQRFVDRTNWRTTGQSPFGIALSRTAATPAIFPFETWQVSAEWMEPGTFMVMMTPRGSRAVSIALHPGGTDEAANRRAIAAGGAGAAMFLHPSGARRITGLRITADGADGLPPSADYVRAAGAAELQAGREWLMELTLDSNRQNMTRDLRPILPLVLRW